MGLLGGANSIRNDVRIASWSPLPVLHREIRGLTGDRPVVVGVVWKSDGSRESPRHVLAGMIDGGVNMSHFDAGGWRAALRLVAVLAVLVFATTQCRRAKVPEVSTAPVPAGFALIPAGEFMMGDALDDGDYEAPQHRVSVSAFHMQTKEVTKAQWDEVRAWGVKNGYTDLPEGEGKAAEHPVIQIPWFGAVKWCNARSEQDALVPCYYTSAARTEVYRTGEVDLATPMVNWAASGYRLPTEAEWEKAARGGLVGKRFPWGDTISHRDANFCNDGNEAYQSGTTGPHPLYVSDEWPYTSPVGSFATNGYGLYDMTGNVEEWCWDCCLDYPDAVETDPRPADTDPRATARGTWRVLRGGTWNSQGYLCCVAFRNLQFASNAYERAGFRPVRCAIP